MWCAYLALEYPYNERDCKSLCYAAWLSEGK